MLLIQQFLILRKHSTLNFYVNNIDIILKICNRLQTRRTVKPLVWRLDWCLLLSNCAIATYDFILEIYPSI